MTRGRVLVAVDDLVLSELLREALRKRGFAVTSALAAERTLVRLGEAEVLVTDLDLPGAGGLALCEAARARWPEVPVVLIAGAGAPDAASRASRAGAWELVEKPLDGDRFALVLDRAVTHGRLLGELNRLRSEHGAPDDEDGAPPSMAPLDEVERRHILAVLGRVGGSKSAAARILGVDRATLYRKLERYGTG